MNIFHLSIVLSDEALAGALARAVAKEYPYVQVAIGEKEDADFTIRDEFLGAPAPVREIMDRVFALSGKEFDFPCRPDNCPFTAFTAGGGGRGVSLCASLYASWRTTQGKRVLFCSFDPYLQPSDPQAGMALLKKVTGGSSLPLKAACVVTENGVYIPAQSLERNLLHELTEEDAEAFLHGLENSGEWDEVVLDVPRAYGYWKNVMDMCETRVVVLSADPLAQKADEAALRELLAAETKDSGNKPPRTLRFCPTEDDAVRNGRPDLYGQLGCEVSALAKQMEAS